MDFKKYLGEAGKYLGTGFIFRESPVWAFISIITILVITLAYKYAMRNHRILSDDYIDENGNPRKTTYSDKH
jgi:hypothetical protein